MSRKSCKAKISFDFSAWVMDTLGISPLARGALVHILATLAEHGGSATRSVQQWSTITGISEEQFAAVLGELLAMDNQTCTARADGEHVHIVCDWMKKFFRLREAAAARQQKSRARRRCAHASDARACFSTFARQKETADQACFTTDHEEENSLTQNRKDALSHNESRACRMTAAQQVRDMRVTSELSGGKTMSDGELGKQRARKCARNSVWHENCDYICNSTYYSKTTNITRDSQDCKTIENHKTLVMSVDSQDCKSTEYQESLVNPEDSHPPIVPLLSDRQSAETETTGEADGDGSDAVAADADTVRVRWSPWHLAEHFARAWISANCPQYISRHASHTLARAIIALGKKQALYKMYRLLSDRKIRHPFAYMAKILDARFDRQEPYPIIDTAPKGFF